MEKQLNPKDFRLLALLVAFIGRKLALSPEARKTRENKYALEINKVLEKLP